MEGDTLKSWRKAQRERLIRERSALDHETLERWRHRIDGFLERSFPGLAGRRVAFCWPIRAEYDARHLAKTLRERGSLTALPVVVAPRQPLVFREWHPGVELAKGALDIPYPVGSQELVPEAVLLPMNGWDARGFHSVPGGRAGPRAGGGIAADDRRGRAGLSPRLRRRLLRPDPGEPRQAAGRHRHLLRAGAPRHHPPAVLGRAGRLRRHGTRVDG